MFNSNMNNNNQNFNNDRKPIFSNDFSNGGNYLNNQSQPNDVAYGNEQFSNQEVPPFLSEIKNLNESESYEAPSLDVLGPSNIVAQNNFSQYNANSTDPLSAYENGNFSFENPTENYNFNNINGENFNSQNNASFNGFQPNINNAEIIPQNNSYQNNSYQNDLYQSNTYQNNPYLNNIGNQESNNAQFYNTNVNMNSSMYNNSYNNYQKDIQEQPSLINTNQYNNVGNPEEQPYILNNVNNNYDSLQNVYNKNVDTNSEQSINQDFNNDVSDLSHLTNSNVMAEEDESNILPDEIKSDATLNEKDYTIVNDILSKNDETDIDKLGLDDSYNEPDSLEIMEIEENKSNIEDNKDNLLKDKVNEVKKLVESFKDDGTKVELEEFDFETMYQIVIKFDK